MFEAHEICVISCNNLITRGIYWFKKKERKRDRRETESSRENTREEFSILPGFFFLLFIARRNPLSLVTIRYFPVL